MSSPTTYLNADGLGVTDVSEAKPLPVKDFGGAVDSGGASFNPALGSNTTALTSTTITETNVQGGVTRVKVTTFAPDRSNPTSIVEGDWTVTP